MDYDPVGKEIAGTRFVAFKTPLQDSFFQNRGNICSSQDVFTPKALVEMVSYSKIEHHHFFFCLNYVGVFLECDLII